MTWASMSIDACKASQLLRAKHPRSAVSRAYYAAYSAVTHELRKNLGVTFGRGWSNPEHGKLLTYVQNFLGDYGFDQERIDQIKGNLRDLRRDRERADYKPQELIDEHDAKASLKRAEQTIREVGLAL